MSDFEDEYPDDNNDYGTGWSDAEIYEPSFTVELSEAEGSLYSGDDITSSKGWEIKENFAW
jgi:hypothetical protein